MKPVKILRDCKYKGKYLYKDDIIETTNDNIEMIKALNRAGFIEPLTQREINKIEEGKNVEVSKEN